MRRKNSILEAAKLMRDYHVGGVVVVEERDGEVIPVGILTDRDIVVELIAKDVPIDSVFLEDVMSHELATVDENRGVWDTIKFMRAKGVRRIVVVNEKGSLVGILSVDDLFEYLSEELSDLVRLFMEGRNREKEVRG